MSKYNNVNPGQYKVAGRERPDTLAQERLKMAKPKVAADIKKSSGKPKQGKRS